MFQSYIANSRILNYQKKWLAGDVIAGVTIAVMLIPQAMAYAILAGLPPIIGLYASIVPLIIYALIGSSHQMAVGPAAMVALLIGSGVAQYAQPFSDDFVSIVVMLSFMVGGIQLLMGGLRLGWMTNFISHPVVSGFTSAAAVIIIVSQLKVLFGVNAPSAHGMFETLYVFVQNLFTFNSYSAFLGVGSMGVLLLSKKISRFMPGALIAILIATVLTWWFGLDELGVAIVGEIPKGLPAFNVPEFSFAQIISFLPLAITIALIGFMESYSVAQKYAIEKKYDLYPNQDLVGLGAANLIGAFFKIFPVTGGFGRTAANAEAGANTQVASIITALLIAIVLIFFTPMFYYLPKSVLAGIIIIAVMNLMDVKEIKHLWKVKKSDFNLLLITAISTWSIGIKEGIIIGIAASILWFIYRSSRPHVAEIGKLPNCEDYRNLKRYQRAQEQDGILVLRIDAQLYYANAAFLKFTIKSLLAKTVKKRVICAVVIDASGINQIDSSAVSSLQILKEDLNKQQIVLMLSGVKGPVKDVLKLSGYWDECCRFLNVHKAVQYVNHSLVRGEPK